MSDGIERELGAVTQAIKGATKSIDKLSERMANHDDEFSKHREDQAAEMARIHGDIERVESDITVVRESCEPVGATPFPAKTATGATALGAGLVWFWEHIHSLFTKGQ